MADIEIVYREGHCKRNIEEYYCGECHCCTADELGCRFYSQEKTEPNVIPFGDCIHAYYEYKHKGWCGKRYEIEGYKDYYTGYSSDPDVMLVTLGYTTYECVKVILNGKCIYNTYDDEEIKA